MSCPLTVFLQDPCARCVDAGVCIWASSPVDSTQSLIMVRLELDQVVMRRMKEDDVEVVKALIKVCTQ